MQFICRDCGGVLAWHGVRVKDAVGRGAVIVEANFFELFFNYFASEIPEMIAWSFYRAKAPFFITYDVGGF